MRPGFQCTSALDCLFFLGVSWRLVTAWVVFAALHASARLKIAVRAMRARANDAGWAEQPGARAAAQSDCQELAGAHQPKNWESFGAGSKLALGSPVGS